MRHDAMRFLWVLALPALLAGCATGGGGSAPRDRDGAMSSTGHANLQLAQNYLADGRAALALDRGLRAEKSDPQSADVQVVLGMIRDRLGDHPRAGEHYARAAKLAPGAGHVLNAQASWLCASGQADAAAPMFAEALRDPLYQHREQAYFNAGKCAYDAGKLDEAEAHLRAGLASAPENQRLLELMAQLKFRKGDFLGARAFVQRREALGTTGPAFLDLAARIETAAGDAGAAARYRARLQAEHPDYAPPAAEGTP